MAFPVFDSNFPSYAIFAENEALRSALYYRKQSEAAELAANQWQDMRLGTFGLWPNLPAQGFPTADYDNRATYACPAGGFVCANSGHTGQNMDADKTTQADLLSGIAASATSAVLEHLAGAAGHCSDRTKGAVITQPSGWSAAERRMQELLAAPAAPEDDGEALAEALRELSQHDNTSVTHEAGARNHEADEHRD